jgi:hypothetical protein
MGNGKWQGGVTRPQAAVAPSTALAERVRIAYASAARRSHGRSPLLVYTDIRAPRAAGAGRAPAARRAARARRCARFIPRPGPRLMSDHVYVV